MDEIKTSEAIDRQRRRFLRHRGPDACGSSSSALIGSAEARTEQGKINGAHAVKPGTHTSFGPLKQIDAGLLNVGYAEAGPADGPPVILLHGWPYDIYSFVDVTPLLAQAGYRVIVPYLRGYGTTRFLSDRHGPQRPAVGGRCRHHRLDGCAQDRKGDACRI